MNTNPKQQLAVGQVWEWNSAADELVCVFLLTHIINDYQVRGILLFRNSYSMANVGRECELVIDGQRWTRLI